MRVLLYDLNWNEFDMENQKLLYMMLVGTTPEMSVKIGNFHINLQSFSQVQLLNNSVHVLHLMSSLPSSSLRSASRSVQF